MLNPSEIHPQGLCAPPDRTERANQVLLAGAELSQTNLANGEVLPEGRIVATIPESIGELVLADLHQEVPKEQGILACVTIALETGR